MARPAPRYLVVDAGGTSTKAVLGTATGSVIAHGVADAAQFRTIPAAVWARRIRAAIEATVQQAQLETLPPLAAIWIGAAGVDTDESAEQARQCLQGVLPAHDTLCVTSDAALLALPGEPCVVAIAGTGSVVFVVDAHGHMVGRVGGLGWLLGDEGSAYGIGRAALRAALEGRAPALLRAIAAAWNVAPRSESLLAYTYAPSPTATRIAMLAPCVTSLAGKEEAARSVLAEQARLLADHITEAWNAAPVRPQRLRLGGAVLRDATYRGMVLDAIAARGASLHADVVRDAATSALVSFVHSTS